MPEDNGSSSSRPLAQLPDDELVIPLNNGGFLCCGPGMDHLWGGTVTIRDADGSELLHWTCDEVREDPEHVVGAFFSAAVNRTLEELRNW